MMLALYDILLHFSVLALLPYFILKMFTARKYREGIPERFGFIDRSKLDRLKGGPVVWVHAVSVGETKAALPLLKLLKERRPGLKIVFSTVTQTGNRTAEKEAAKYIDALIYFPLDISWVVRRVIRALRPEIFLVLEKEVWPNLLKTLSSSNIPAIVVNGTISERSFRRFKRFGFFFKDIFSSMAFFCARTEEDRQRAVEAGVNKDRARALGNIKFDFNAPPADKAFTNEILKAFGINENDKLFIAGSTHAGEEELILNVYRQITSEQKRLKLMIAPRHPERFSEVEGLIKKSGLKYSKRTRPEAADVILIDTVGELMKFYSLSDVALVGGSLIGGIGGHNLLEPAFYSKPVLYGKHLTTYLGMAELLEAAGGSIRVDGEKGLYEALHMLLNNETEALRMGKSAKSVVEANRGAAIKTAEVIERFLKPGRK